ncbi:MAG TPA: L-histidine N(alpha)-methyltransferase [Flavobacteriaceae bacterium]|nr:L-histidine N(alpha)-methyltransferase [Flavobacteriaceae bacterium]
MKTETNTIRSEAFKKEVRKGLTDFPKHLSSKYFYDKKGDKLFQDIMAMPAYYLTDCELEIISEHKRAIAELFRDKQNGLDLVELGAGDGKKTKVLLDYMSKKNFNFVYKPIDISENVLELLTGSLASEMPLLTVKPVVGEYFEVLERIKNLNKRKKVIMILGSNIGNLLHPQAIDFLQKLHDVMTADDLLFIGMDQKKNPETILAAYNDPEGITEAFNKNVLVRINSELGGNFDIKKFRHWEVYNPETGTAKSYLVAAEAMDVTIEALDLRIHFEQWETIHTEISQKYDDQTVEWMAQQANLEIVQTFSDSRSYFKNYVFRKQ